MWCGPLAGSVGLKGRRIAALQRGTGASALPTSVERLFWPRCYSRTSPMKLEDKLAELERRNAAARAGGGEERTRRQHEAGKLSARERIELLLDERGLDLVGA